MMTRHRMTNWIGMICAAVVLFGFAQNAAAAGTEAGTSISNEATVTYYVGTADYTTTGTVEFKVDYKINMSMAPLSPVETILPGQEITLYTRLENTGNSKAGGQEFLLALAQAWESWTPAPTISVSTNPYASADSSDPSTDSYTSSTSANVPADHYVNIKITATVPDTATGSILLGLIAKANVTNSDGVQYDDDSDFNDDATEQIVFADGQGNTVNGTTLDIPEDGLISVLSEFLIGSAALSVTKKAVVVNDGMGNTTSTAKAIPGATVEYTITISNDAAATATATGISIVDNISALPVTFDPDGYFTGIGIKYTATNGSVTYLTNLADSSVDNGQYDTGAKTVTVSDLTLAPGESATVSFKVVIIP